MEGQGSIFDDFWMIFRASWLTLGMFSAALPPLLTWFSLFLLRSSANFAKKIQELTEEKAENPRTCRGQSRERNPYRRLQEKLNLKALFFSTPLPYRKLLFIAALQTPKTLGGGTPPRGASIRRPPGTACEIALSSSACPSSHPLSGFFFSEVLVSPS